MGDPEAINHLVVFLTGVPFPSGYAATVHFLWPSPTTASWSLLGMISNDKPSAIFKLGGKKALSNIASSMDDMDEAFAPSSNLVAQLGISIEPIDVVFSQVSGLPTKRPFDGTTTSEMSLVPAQDTSCDSIQIATKLLENFYNYCTSFATTHVPQGSNVLFNINWETTYIPIKVQLQSRRAQNLLGYSGLVYINAKEN